ncbi:hypothetical protein M408DRAFT_309401 [Serendipita vermifera MAFF 305830]|uniref:Cytochrome P450 n=1 Tax=Serendipita vermifera MAFF 305830 TaxID=933852 RepID=A0A0C3BMB6_SERVB|nr:hypothetical protein M408DRAFT_309401 [Serendipita vermifera MAFF 305830]
MFEQFEANKTGLAIACAVATASGLVWSLLSGPPYIHTIGGRTSPPGPKRHFILQNAKNFPTTHWYDRLAELQKEFGDVVYFQVPGRPILVLNALEDAEELLVKRANIWSARPRNYMLESLMAFGWSLVLIQPGEAHNQMRTIFRKVLGQRTVTQFDTMLEEGASSFHDALSGFSGDPEPVVSSTIGSIIIRLAYGDQVHQKHGDELVALNAGSVRMSTWANSQLWLVNFIRPARFLPSWIPGLKFHKYAKEGKEMYDKIRYWAFGEVKQETEKEAADLCVVTRFISNDETSNGYLRDATALMYMGTLFETDTTAALTNFIASMLVHPDVQKRVQKELDEVVGKGRVPTMADIASLEYLRAAWNETLRLFPVLIASVPHSATQDDVWKGYFIPKNTMILPNQAFMLRDPRLWGEDAHVFDPERFIGSRAVGHPDLETLVYGWGRRRCPGRFLAERNGLLYAAVALAAYDIVPVEGAKLPIKLEFSEDKIRRPTNLNCRFVARH